MTDKLRAFITRQNEPDYARLPKTHAPKLNQYGKPIDLIDESSVLAGKSLNINGDTEVGQNPDRYKQHGFYFNADNCIACHACESACSEKNNLSPHLAFRSVGYVEGGTYPDYHRLNLSMACNHCDDPVCLKGCPTRAYTKFAEYGAVLQDPDICFGCGYCTWVCPYNAPQLDPVNGQVEKCNMCVDRLEVGLKPACVSACLAGALDFGVIETTPENRDQLQTQVPGFPDPEISHPNIRFQQTNSLPREMKRPDSMPLHYLRDEHGQQSYKTKVRETNKTRYWGLSKLSSRENPIVIFTLMSQAAVGVFLWLFLAPRFGLELFAAKTQPVAYSVALVSTLAMLGFGLFMATAHLGKPFRFYRGFNNLRYSPVSREAAALMIFFALSGLYTLITLGSHWFEVTAGWLVTLSQYSAWGAAIAGPLALYFMYRIYRIPARPFWNHWQVVTSFYGSMFALGSVVLGIIYGMALINENQSIAGLTQMLVWPLLLGLIIEAVGLVFHRRYMIRFGGEAAASHYLQSTEFGKSYITRNIGLGSAIAAVAALALLGPAGDWAVITWAAVTALIIVTAVVGRAMFYVLVIPTTMPGAFFWRNKGFQDHARETRLADIINAGIVPDAH